MFNDCVENAIVNTRSRVRCVVIFERDVLFETCHFTICRVIASGQVELCFDLFRLIIFVVRFAGVTVQLDVVSVRHDVTLVHDVQSVAYVPVVTFEDCTLKP